MGEIAYEIVTHYGVVGDERGGWKKELNLVSWNGRTPKLDIRDWSPDHQNMGKGITLTREQASRLVELLGGALEQTAGGDAPEST